MTNIITLIERKKAHNELTEEEIRYLVDATVDGSAADCQLSAFLMAVCLNGMTDKEAACLTRCMADSGDKVDLSSVKGVTVDKHSTGGVGDSTTFVVLPVLASMGYRFAKMSGRSLGHTGGTIDKLESIKGFRTELSTEEFFTFVNKSGIALTGQSAKICPADKRLYAIRDITATVDSIPLIASSIMSKKLAGGADNIVLDVKCGNGAFMTNQDYAERLAVKMVEIGKHSGKNVCAVITDMNQPLDSYVGNSLEVLGALEVLEGAKNRLYSVSRALVIALLVSIGLEAKSAEAAFEAEIESGRAKAKFLEFVEQQGGDVSCLNAEYLTDSRFKAVITAKKEGYISGMECKKIGEFAGALGAGRTHDGDVIKPKAGLKLHVSIGTYVNTGDVLADVFYEEQAAESLFDHFENLISYSDKPVKQPPLVIKSVF